MLIKEKISIEEFDDKSYQIKLVEPLEEEKAVLTHYLHNIHNGVAKYYNCLLYTYHAADDLRLV